MKWLRKYRLQKKLDYDYIEELGEERVQKLKHELDTKNQRIYALEHKLERYEKELEHVNDALLVARCVIEKQEDIGDNFIYYGHPRWFAFICRRIFSETVSWLDLTSDEFDKIETAIIDDLYKPFTEDCLRMVVKGDVESDEL